MNNKNDKTAIKLIVLAICLVFLIPTFLMYSNTKEDSISKKYDSIEDALSISSLEINIPENIKFDDSVEVSSYLNKMIHIKDSTSELKIDSWIDNNADPLGVYTDMDYTVRYSVDTDNILGISFLKIRKDNENTIINWVANRVSYGYKTQKNLSLEDALKILSLSEEHLCDYIDVNTLENKNAEKQDNGEYTYFEEYRLRYKVEYNKDNLMVMDTMGKIKMYYVDNTLALVVVGDEWESYIGIFGDKTLYTSVNGLYFIYNDISKVDTGDNVTDNYLEFLSTIGDILDSIEIT